MAWRNVFVTNLIYNDGSRSVVEKALRECLGTVIQSNVNNKVLQGLHKGSTADAMLRLAHVSQGLSAVTVPIQIVVIPDEPGGPLLVADWDPGGPMLISRINCPTAVRIEKKAQCVVTIIEELTETREVTVDVASSDPQAAAAAAHRKWIIEGRPLAVQSNVHLRTYRIGEKEIELDEPDL